MKSPKKEKGEVRKLHLLKPRVPICRMGTRPQIAGVASRRTSHAGARCPHSCPLGGLHPILTALWKSKAPAGPGRKGGSFLRPRPRGRAGSHSSLFPTGCSQDSSQSMILLKTCTHARTQSGKEGNTPARARSLSVALCLLFAELHFLAFLEGTCIFCGIIHDVEKHPAPTGTRGYLWEMGWEKTNEGILCWFCFTLCTSFLPCFYNILKRKT